MVVSISSKSVIKNCEFCGKPFQTYFCKLKNGRKKYCSLTCFHHSSLGKSKPHTKEQNQKIGDALRGKPHSWNSAEWHRLHPSSSKVKRICETCGKTFFTQPCRIKNGHGRFCSHQCCAKSTEYQKQRSESLKRGQYRPFLGHHHSVEAKAKAHKTSTELWQNPEFVAKVMAARAVKPTKPEKHLQVVLNKHFPQFEYNGDFSLGITIGGMIPDFVNVNGKKQVIEVFGDYWHTKRADSTKDTELGRIMAYKPLGFNCLIFWEHDLNEKSEGEIVNMVKAFTGGRKCQL